MMDEAQFAQEVNLLHQEGKLKIIQDDPAFEFCSLQAWEAAFDRITPSQLYERFRKAGGEGHQVKVAVRLKEAGCTVEVRHDASWDDGDRENLFAFKIWNQEDGSRSGDLRRAFLREHEQHHHVAKHYLAASVSLMQALGVPLVKADCEEVGGYSWAKFGFCPPTRFVWRKLRSHILNRVDEEALRVHYGDQAYPVTPEEMVAIRAVLDVDFSKLSECFSSLTMLNRVIDNTGPYAENPLTVGKALLLYTKWLGVLPIDEASPNFQCFKHYTASDHAQERGYDAGR